MDAPQNRRASRRDRVFTIIGIVLCVILVPLLIANVTMIVKSYTKKNEVPNFLGITPLIVLTDSMSGTIESGDLIICKNVKAENIKAGDIISFFDPVSTSGAVVTHRVVEVIQDGDGTLSFRTKGDANNTEDKISVPAENLVGGYVFRLAGMGNVAMFMQTTPGLIVCVVVPLILLVGYDVLRRKLYEREKKDNMDELMAELEALRAAQSQTAAPNQETAEPEEANELPATEPPATEPQEDAQARDN